MDACNVRRALNFNPDNIFVAAFLVGLMVANLEERIEPLHSDEFSNPGDELRSWSPEGERSDINNCLQI